MDDEMKTFGATAKSLARNPLGIIALFIVLVYGFASLVTAFAGSYTPAERLPLIYFLIGFPVLVLGVFAWLVSVEVVRAAGPGAVQTGDGWRNHILWVDDRPENNTYERQAFEGMGLRFTLALSTDEAFERLAQARFAAIISDMGRKEGPREGYVLLDRLRKEGDRTPLFFYSASNAPEHKRETREHGGQGCTNNAQELFEMVTRAVIQRQTA